MNRHKFMVSLATRGLVELFRLIGVENENMGRNNRLRIKWAGLDSNQRKLTLMGLQPIPFSLSGTDPIYFINKSKRSLLFVWV